MILGRLTKWVDLLDDGVSIVRILGHSVYASKCCVHVSKCSSVCKSKKNKLFWHSLKDTMANKWWMELQSALIVCRQEKWWYQLWLIID